MCCVQHFFSHYYCYLNTIIAVLVFKGTLKRSFEDQDPSNKEDPCMKVQAAEEKANKTRGTELVVGRTRWA